MLPGFIDAHTHVLLRSSYDEFELARQMAEENLGHRAASAVQAMSVSVRHGFTTIRDLGTEGAGYFDVGLRDAAREVMVPGPRMLVAGPAIRSTGRYPLHGERHRMTFQIGIDSCTGATARRKKWDTTVSEFHYPRMHTPRSQHRSKAWSDECPRPRTRRTTALRD
jgi:imidazolonepropionase-like amidohydrolase